MKPRSYFICLLSFIPFLTACPRPYPIGQDDEDPLGPDCQSIQAITVTPPCMNSYPGLILTASGYDRRGRESKFEWQLYLQKDTTSIDTLQKPKVFYGSDHILIVDSLTKNAPKFIVSVRPQYWRCAKHNYFSLVKKSTANSFCPVWTSQKIQ